MTSRAADALNFDGLQAFAAYDRKLRKFRSGAQPARNSTSLSDPDTETEKLVRRLVGFYSPASVMSLSRKQRYILYCQHLAATNAASLTYPTKKAGVPSTGPSRPSEPSEPSGPSRPSGPSGPPRPSGPSGPSDLQGDDEDDL
jgi:hypothetical protein